MARADYRRQDSPQTLREGLEEYYLANPGLLDPAELPERVSCLFRQHDAGHVVFGCDTSLRGEALIDLWTVVGTTAGLRGYLEYFEHPQVNQIFSEVGYLRIARDSIACLPDLLRVFARSRRLAARWPWADYERYLDRPLAEIRAELGLRLV